MTSSPARVTEEQIAAAQLRIVLDEKLGRHTPDVVRRIAAMAGGDSVEEELTLTPASLPNTSVPVSERTPHAASREPADEESASIASESERDFEVAARMAHGERAQRQPDEPRTWADLRGRTFVGLVAGLNAGQHLAVDAVVAFVDGELSARARDRAAEHLASCQSCAAEVAEQRLARNEIRGGQSPSIPASLLAKLRSLRQTVEEVEAEHRGVLEDRRRVLGEEHPDTVASRNNLANALGDLGRLEEAEVEHRAVLEIRRRVLGEEHPDTLASRNNLANVLGDLGRLEEAEVEYRAVLEIRRRVDVG
jgi:tetratricopeptide (TPR) repeat protein